MKKYYIGLDVGGTKCAVTLAHSQSEDEIEIFYKKRFETEFRKPDVVLSMFKEIIDEALEEHSLAYKDISCIGISCGGPLNPFDGIVLSPPHLNSWDNIHITEYFESLTGIKTVLCNDADACALAEWKFGAGKGCDNMVFLTVGTGFGAGLILNRSLYVGKGLGGEVGHIRLRRRGPIGFGKQGTTEAYCSGAALGCAGVRRVKKALKNGKTPLLWEKANHSYDEISAKLICNLAEEGDEMCLDLCSEFGSYLGEAISILIDLIDPDRVVLGGVYMRSEKLIKPSLEKVVKEEIIPRHYADVEILPAGLGEKIGDYAALSVAVIQSEKEGK